MKSVNPGLAIRAGLVGTLAMTALMYAAPLMGLPPMDLLRTLGGLFPLGISPYVVGGLMHLGIGVTLALLYAVVFERILPGPLWVRGAVFSLVPWLFAVTLMGPAMAWVQAVVHPPVEARTVVNPCGVVASGARASSPWLLRMMSLMAHLVYGGVVGSIYRRNG